MKLLSICDPHQYGETALEVPQFYQQLSQHSAVEFYHLPTNQVFCAKENRIPAISCNATVNYQRFSRLNQMKPAWMELTDIDLIFCRTLKPFPLNYLDVLSQWEHLTRFVNSPSQKKQQMQSDFLLKVAKNYMPAAIATDNSAKALAFFEKYQVIVAKKANSCGGRGVYKIWYETGVFNVDNFVQGTQQFSDFSQVMSHLQAHPAESIQFCRYLPRTDAGDKRVVVVDGEIYGSFLRRSKTGHWVNNVGNDGECSLVEVTADEIEAITQTVGQYQALGLHTLGYDFLMDNDGTWRISEINAGNIGGFARLEQLSGKSVMQRLINWLISYTQGFSQTRTTFPLDQSQTLMGAIS